jgi:hypothetical protein
MASSAASVNSLHSLTSSTRIFLQPLQNDVTPAFVICGSSVTKSICIGLKGSFVVR